MRVLIIGGSSDIGISLRDYLINKGYEVINTYYKHMIDNGIRLDITNEDEVSRIINNLGKIDVLINMASISRDNIFINSQKEDFMKVLEVNLVGMYTSCLEYVKRNNGMIINISSTDGIDTGSEYSMFYNVSKAGIISLSKSISMSVANNVVCICPNWIDSDSTRNMNKDYLNSELKRIKQDRLITIDEFNNCIDNVIKGYYRSGSIIRLDVKNNDLMIKYE